MAGPLGPVHEVTLPLVAGATAAIVGTPPDVEVRSAERLVTPLSVRERQRSERGRSSDEPGFSVSRDGQAVPSIVEALRHIDDAAVAGPGPTAHRDIFGGVAGGVPEALVGDALCLYGTGAVYAGRTWLAARALASLQERAQSHPAPYLALAATYALWTADLEPFASTTRTLAVAVDALERGGVRHGSAPIKELVERLSAAIEPLGDTELSARLRASARTPLAESAASVRGLGRSVPGIEGSLRHTGRPPPRECLSASRFIRRLVGRELGLEPDAAFGRLRFAPRLGLLSGRLDVAGLRTGDARVRIGISRSGASSELRIHQEAGRVPLNLVFAPWLATSGSASLTVLLDGSPVEPDVRPSAGGTRVQMQFPLDRPREVAIFVGSP